MKIKILLIIIELLRLGHLRDQIALVAELNKPLLGLAQETDIYVR